MKQYRILGVLAAASLMLASCADRVAPEKGTVVRDAHSFVSAKIVNTSVNASASELMVQVGANTRENIMSLEAVPGVASVEPLFFHTPGKEEMEARFGLDRWMLVSVAGGKSVEAVAESIAGLDKVEKVEFSHLISRGGELHVASCDVPGPVTKAVDYPFDDPYLVDQWHYINNGDVRAGAGARIGADINVKDAWSLCAGDPDIIVGVIDEGIKWNHPDLADNMWVNEAEFNGTEGVDDDGNGLVDDIYGYNFALRDTTITYTSGIHGTHCAGTIAAVNNNGIGVCGVAGGTGKGDGCRLMSAQAAYKGSFPMAGTLRAVKYAADNGAAVINCSYGYSGDDITSDSQYATNYPAELAIYEYFENTPNDVTDGGICVFSAGNDGLDHCEYPAGYYKFISVGALASDYLPAYYSSYGPGTSIFAPGGEVQSGNAYGEVLSTVVPEISNGDEYAFAQGTSMSAPHMTGVVALGLSYAKKLGKKYTRDEFKSLLLTSTNSIDDLLVGTRTSYGGTKQLYKYRGGTGAGAIDVWKLFMNIEGTPCLEAIQGETNFVDLEEYFGGNASSLTYLGVEISDRDKASLGLEEDPVIQYGRLKITPTKYGSAKFVIRAINGGTEIGGVKEGGMEISRTVSVICRPVVSKNGGWL